MAKQKFTHFIPRSKPKKRGPGAHKKNKNKHEKRRAKKQRYKGQGRVWCYLNVMFQKKFLNI